ncbi:MAG: LysM domain-containing protein [Aeromicrobium sp.]
MRLSWSGWVLIVWSAVLVGSCAPDAPRLLGQVGGPSFADALLALGTLVAMGLAAWVLVVAALVAAGASSRVVAMLSPGLLRRALLAGAAGALVLGPAHAEQAVGPDTGIQHSVSGLLLPDRPDIARSHHRTPPPTPPASDRSVTVRPGDTLWAIAARSLPSGATARQVADATRAWHDANRDVIGDDPDLIFPTQRLEPPSGKDHP